MNPEDRRTAQRGSIELAGVTKRFGETAAVRNIDLKIPGGCYCCLLGPSGCGKTTILRMIAGHESPTEGAVLIDGENVVDKPPVERGTAMMFQSYALFPHLSCMDNVAFNLKMRGMGKDERRARALEMLDRVRMKSFADRLPAQLSSPTRGSCCSTSPFQHWTSSCACRCAASSGTSRRNSASRSFT